MADQRSNATREERPEVGHRLASLRRLWPVLGLAMLAIGLVALRPLLGAYEARFVTELLMLTALAIGWNLIGGYAGYVSFGHVAFFGIGAYTAGVLLARDILPLPLAVVAAVGVSTLFALIVGLPLLRVRGHYFAIATFGVAEALRQIISVTSDLTGGGRGLNVPLVGGGIDERTSLFYFSMAGLVVIGVAVSLVVVRSRLGYGLRAIRASEDAAASLGVNTTRYKLIAFALSAAIWGAAGALYAPWQLFIDPPTVFNVELSVEPVVLALVGGVGTVVGPLVGGVVVQTVGEVVWGSFLELHSAFLGLLLILVVILLPRGLVSLVGLRRRGRGGSRSFLAAIRRYSV
jgi:branched-chain amino acid transport system permease protein